MNLHVCRVVLIVVVFSTCEVKYFIVIVFDVTFIIYKIFCLRIHVTLETWL